MQDEFKKLTLDTISNGAAKELFQKALDEIMDNIADENRDPTAARTITMKFTFAPSMDRTDAKIKIDVSTKLRSVSAPESRIFMRQEGRKNAAYAHNYKQPSLPFGEVTSIKG